VYVLFIYDRQKMANNFLVIKMQAKIIIYNNETGIILDIVSCKFVIYISSIYPSDLRIHPSSPGLKVGVG